MNIQSPFNSGVEGFNKATEIAYQAAEDIAKYTAHTTEASNNLSDNSSTSQDGSSSNSSPNSSSDSDSPAQSLSQSLVNLKVAEHQAKASANVIKTADENLGTLLDVTL